MAKQTINLGTAPDAGDGDNLRAGGDKINDNFDELYAANPDLQSVAEDASPTFANLTLTALAAAGILAAGVGGALGPVASQAANGIFAGPGSGAAAAPSFRALVVADLPFAGIANGVATLGADGKIPSAQIPNIALSDTFVVASQAAMLALSTAERGDVAIRTDLSKSFILSTNSPGTLADWKELLTPTDAVTSVAGLTGAISAAGLQAAIGTWPATFTITPAVNTSALVVSGYSLTGSNAQSLIDLAGTWNTSGTPTAIKLNITDTASNASAKFLDFLIGGTSKYSFRKDGYQFFGASRFIHTYTNADALATELGSLGLVDAYNTFVGVNAGNFTSSATTGVEGGRNVGIGYLALSSLTTAWQNTAVGHRSQQKTTSGIYNTSVGAYTLIENTTGEMNTGIGADALWLNQTGSNNTGVGAFALQQNTTGGNNVAVGKDALKDATSADSNVAIGVQALWKTTTGSQNTVVGLEAGRLNLTGALNTAFGSRAFKLSQTGSSNVAFGAYSLASADGAGNNTAVGYAAGELLTTGSTNTLIGYLAGGNLTTGSSNIIIGANINAASATGSNQLNIGGIITGSLSTGAVTITGSLTVGPLLAGVTANVTELRNGAISQTFYVDNNYTDVNNYERAEISWAANDLLIGTRAAGTGSLRAINFTFNGSAKWWIPTSGNWLAGTDNTYSIGADGANRPSNIHVAGGLVGSGYSHLRIGVTAASASLKGIADGVLGIANYNADGFTGLILGVSGTTYNRIKHQAAGVLSLKLADDSAYATWDALAYRVSGTKVVGAQGAAVADATDAASTMARLNDLLARVRAHGLIA